MFFDADRIQNVYVACGFTDMRKQIDGLAAIVELQYKAHFDTESVFLFCGRKSDRIKALLWDGLSAHFCYPNHYEEWHCFCWFLG